MIQFSESDLIFSIIAVSSSFAVIVGFFLFIIIRNFKLRIRREKERIQLMNDVQNNERDRISENLHDELGPKISSVKKMISNLLESDDINEIKESLREANKSMIASNEMIRKIIQDIKQVSYAKGGLRTALSDLQKFYELSSGIKINISWKGNSMDPDENLETQLYRVLNEMMNNSMKHSEAKTINIEIENMNAELIIKYSDDGIGFDENMVNKGMGLSNLRKRIQLLKGTFDFTSVPGKGVEYKIVI